MRLFCLRRSLLSIRIKTASRSHAKSSTDSYGKIATMLSLLILEILTTHAGETDRFRFVSLELTALAYGNNRPIAVFQQFPRKPTFAFLKLSIRCC
jgi:hypothetical protein